MMENRPDSGAEGSSYNPLDEWTDSAEPSKLWQSIQNFYNSSQATYDQVGSLMQGEGGSSLEDAAERLNQLTDCTVKSFGLAAEAIADEYPGDTEAIVEAITTLFINDDQKRISQLKQINGNVEYQSATRDDTREGFAYLLSSLDPSERQDTIQELYFRSLSMDVGQCLSQGSPQNVNDVAERKRQERRAKIKSVAGDVAKMAGTALLTAAIIRFTGR